jgi:hypothetical protein
MERIVMVTLGSLGIIETMRYFSGSYFLSIMSELVSVIFIAWMYYEGFGKETGEKISSCITYLKGLIKPKPKRFKSHQVWYEEYSVPNRSKQSDNLDNRPEDTLTFKNLVLTKKYKY